MIARNKSAPLLRKASANQLIKSKEDHKTRGSYLFYQERLGVLFKVCI